MANFSCVVISCFLLYCMKLFSVCEGGYCEYPYQCSQTCYRTVSYGVSCGWKGWRRCTNYRPEAYTCYSTCYNRACCAGYRGSDCNEAICDGAHACLNGGQCILPNTCSCRPGYAEPTCTDIDECSDGSAGCNQICTNTLGSYICSCQIGFQLSFDRETCEDVDECMTGNGGCDHTCSNSIGSFTCSCDQGYVLHPNGLNCVDVDECSNGLTTCDHDCSNTIGSYNCSCQSGYYLGLDEQSCFDVNECLGSPYPCQQECINLPGTFRCDCSVGYSLNITDGVCYDINECHDNNGGCSDTCINTDGSFVCQCPTGYKLDTDDSTCIDKDECSDRTSGCDQQCTNLNGSYSCSCDFGFKLLSDKHTCENIDDCDGVECLNGGTCVDGIGRYTCQCLKGFKDEHCETDIDECSFLNGGCQQNCTNTFGSFVCSCEEPSYLHQNGLHCIGVFEKHGLTDKVLPVGDYIYSFDSSMTKAINFSSTSKWYQHLSNQDIIYTSGIVHVESNGLTLPLSMTGVELHISNTSKIFSTLSSYTDTDGVEDYIQRYVNETITTVIRDSDLYTFIASNSFARSYFTGLQSLLPDWVSFYSPDGTFLPVTELSTSIMTGSEIEESIYCRYAPVYRNKLYNVLVLSVEIAFEIFGDAATIFLNTQQDRICIVTDIFQDGGTVFVTFPPTAAFDLPVLQNTIKTANANVTTNLGKRSIQDMGGIQIEKIRGFGLSINKGIQVKYEEDTIEVWNGDHLVDYRVFDHADFWVSADVKLNNDDLELSVDADLFLAVPNPLNLFTDTFEDKWEIFFDVHNSEGEIASIDFEINDFIVSIGGTGSRDTCGRDANPAGIFGSITPKIIPFYDVPIIGSLLAENLYLFMLSGEYDHTYSPNQIQAYIVQSFNNIRQYFDNFLDDIAHCIHNTIAELQDIIAQLKNTVNDVIGALAPFSATSVNSVLQLVGPLESKILNVTATFRDFQYCDLSDSLKNMKQLIVYEITNVRLNLTRVIQSSSDSLTASLQNSDGFGLQYKGSLTLRITSSLSLSFDFLRLEYVESKGSLGQCGRFHKVFELMKNEEARRFYLEIDGGPVMGYFFVFDGLGLGFAQSTESKKFIIQVAAIFRPFRDLGFLEGGFEVTVDLFISNSGIYAYAEATFFNLFYIQLELGIELGNDDWYKLKLHLDGRFVVPKNQNVAPQYTGKRSTSISEDKFSTSLMGMIKELLNKVANFANDRLEEAQALVSKAQSKLDKAQDWLEDKKEIVRKVQAKFDNAVDYLEDRKEDLERAKGVFESASDKLREARDKVNILCRIKSCSRICIPGIKCGWLYCRLTSCMFRIENPFCVARNILCAAIRAAAFALYDLAIMALHIPIIALDAAKAVVWVAQVAVDKASSALVLAEAAIDIAKLGLEGAKAGLEVVNIALEGVKVVVATGFQVLNFIIEHGLQKIIDVRNCRFSLDIDSPIQPILDVSCELKPFSTKRITIGMRINFLNPLQSLWHAAKGIVDSVLDNLNILDRKKREASQTYMTYMHPLIRKLRSTNGSDIDFNTTWTDILDTMNNTRYGVLDSYSVVDEDYDQRVYIYNLKCQTFKRVGSFLDSALVHLSNVNTEFINAINEMDEVKQNLSNFNMDMFANFTLDLAGINTTVANDEFNMTDDYINSTFQETVDSLYNNSYILKMFELAKEAQSAMDEQKQDIENFDFLAEWSIAMNETTPEYFETDECIGLFDCFQYSIYLLNTLFITDDSSPEYNETIHTIDILESTFLELMNNSNTDVYTIHNSSTVMLESMDQLTSLCRFCDQPPSIMNDMENRTAVYGRSIDISCDATGDYLTYQWMAGGKVISNETEQIIRLHNLTNDHAVSYRCMASNVVASASTGPGYLTIVDECPAGTMELYGYCKVCHYGTYQPLAGQQQCISCPAGYTTSRKGTRRENQCLSSAGEKEETIIIVVATVVPFVIAVVVAIAVYVKYSQRGKRKVFPSTCTSLEPNKKYLCEDKMAPSEIRNPAVKEPSKLPEPNLLSSTKHPDPITVTPFDIRSISSVAVMPQFDTAVIIAKPPPSTLASDEVLSPILSNGNDVTSPNAGEPVEVPPSYNVDPFIMGSPGICYPALVPPAHINDPFDMLNEPSDIPDPFEHPTLETESYTDDTAFMFHISQQTGEVANKKFVNKYFDN